MLESIDLEFWIGKLFGSNRASWFLKIMKIVVVRHRGCTYLTWIRSGQTIQQYWREVFYVTFKCCFVSLLNKWYVCRGRVHLRLWCNQVSGEQLLRWITECMDLLPVTAFCSEFRSWLFTSLFMGGEIGGCGRLLGGGGVVWCRKRWNVKTKEIYCEWMRRVG